jgi:polar amino acid transport system ATP-binding protein
MPEHDSTVVQAARRSETEQMMTSEAVVAAARRRNASMPGPAVQFVDVHKSFGSTTVLDGLNLEIGRGETVALIGPSGSGKTTVLRMLMTLERPDRGGVLLHGSELWSENRRGRVVPAKERHLRKMRQKVGMVFQHYTLFPHMSVLKNLVEGPVHSLGLPYQEAVERAEALLEMVGMAEYRLRKPAQLSGGQRQRVAIARALAMKPDIMLFDEVTSALDPELVGEVLRVIKDIAAQDEMTILLVTHEMHFAEHVADTVMMFDGGRVVESGTPEKIFRNPSSDRTRKFLDAVLSRERI